MGYELFVLALYVASATVGAVPIVLIRKTLGSRFPMMSGYLAIIVSALVIVVLASVLGLDMSRSFSAILLAVFVGTHWTQPDPWSVEGLCRPMAAVSGLVAIFAAINGNLTAVAASLGVTGLLVYLSNREVSA